MKQIEANVLTSFLVAQLIVEFAQTLTQILHHKNDTTNDLYASNYSSLFEIKHFTPNVTFYTPNIN